MKLHAFTKNADTAARVVARLVARDGRIDWREIEFLDRTGAFFLLGIDRARFMALLSQSLCSREEPALAAIRERRLQLLVAALLVYVAEIDRDVEPGERALVQRAFDAWRITPRLLEKEMRVPLARSLCALGRLPQAA